MLATTRDRIGAATGAAFVALIFAGNAINVAGTDQSGHPSGAKVLKDVAHQASSTSATVGFVMELLGFVGFFVFLGYLAVALRRHSGRSFSAGTAVVAGVTMLAIKLGSAASVATLYADRNHLAPQLAQVLNDIGGAAFVLSWVPFAIFIAATAAALRESALVGKPTSYLGVTAGVVGLVFAIIGLHNPYGANPVAFMLGMLWLLIVSVRLAVKPPTETEDAPRNAAAEPRVAVTV